MNRHGQPQIVLTDKLRSFGARMKIIGNAHKLETGCWLTEPLLLLRGAVFARHKGQSHWPTRG